LYDKIDPISEEYYLEVSSPGVDRVLKTEREYRYFTGREVSVKLYAAVEGKKEFDGVLAGFDNDTVTVRVDGEEVSFLRKEAVFVRLAFRI
jgi:ribosome maturation factor RimP